MNKLIFKDDDDDDELGDEDEEEAEDEPPAKRTRSGSRSSSTSSPAKRGKRGQKKGAARPPRVQVGSGKLLSLRKRKKGRKRHWLRRRINQEELECLFQMKILNCLKKIRHLKPGLF